jgi:hypothetical protein
MLRRKLLAVVVAGAAIASGVSLFGQAPAPAAPSPTPSAPPCSSAEHRQFDFWLGDWNVRDPQGALVGTNLITKEFGGCVLQEHWTGGNMTGGSFNIYRSGTRQWHQSWVDSNGTLLVLDGEFKDGVMTLAGEGKRGNQPIRHRISWAPAPDGKVRQLWETSNDGGTTWSVVFDGRYERKDRS